MAEETQIVLSVDSTGLVRGVTDLDSLSGAGARAETSAQNLERSFERTVAASTTVAASVRDVSSSTLLAANSVDAASRKFAGLASATTSLGASAQGANRAVVDLEKVGSSLGASAASAGRAEVSVTALVAAQSALARGADGTADGLGKIVRQGDAAAASMARTGAASQKLTVDLARTNTTLGATSFRNVDELSTSLGATTGSAQRVAVELRAVGAAGAAAGAGLQSGAAGAAAAVRNLNLVGLSAGQAKNAMAQVPAQLTDVFTQLAGGQNPLLILIQQGGQLRDVFGGVGNVFRGLATVFTPFRLGIAAVVGVLGGLGAAFLRGQDERDEFTKAIVSSGNAAGVTADQLGAMAKAVADIGGGTQGKAAEVLAQIASSGKVGADNMVRFAQATIEFERAGGAAAKETVDAFADLAKSPLEASVKLNEAQNYLTASTYETIRSLVEQGRTVEAGRVAQEAFYQATAERAPQMEQSLGFLTKRWRELKEAIAAGADAAAGIGRANPLEDQIKKTEETIARLRNGEGRLSRGNDFAAEIKGQTAYLDTLRQERGFAEDSARAKEIGARQTKATIEFQKDGIAYLSQEETKRQSLVKLAQQFAEANGSISAQDVANRAAAIRSKGAEKPAAGPTSNEQAAREEVAQLETIKRTLSDINLLRATGQITAKEEALRIHALEIDALNVRKQAIEQQIRFDAGRKGGANDAAQGQTKLLKITEEIATKERDARNLVTIAIYEQKVAIEAVIAAEKKQFADEGQASYLAQIAARQELRNSLFANRDALAEEARLIAVEAGALGQTAQARALVIEKLRIQIDLEKELNRINVVDFDDGEIGREVAREQARINAVQAEVNATSRAALEVSKVAADNATKEWEKASEQIGQALTDSLFKAFDSGDSFGRTFIDSIKNLLKTTVLRVLFQPVQQGATNIVANLVGQATGQGTDSESAIAGAQKLQQLYGYAKNAYTAVGNYFGGGAAAAASSYSLAGGGLAAGSTYGSIGGASSVYGSIGGASGTYGSIGAAGGAATTPAASTGLGAGMSWGTLYAAFAVWAYGQSQKDYQAGFTAKAARDSQNQLGGNTYASISLETTFDKIFKGIGFSDKWASILSGSTPYAKIFGRGEERITSQGVQGMIGGGDFSGTRYAETLQKGGFLRSDKRKSYEQDVGGELDALFDDAARGIFDKAKEYGEALGLPIEKLASITKEVRVELGDDAKKNEEAILKALGGYGEALVEPFAKSIAPLKEYGETVAQTIERVAGTLLGVNDALESIGIKAFETSVQGGQGAVALEKAFGGLDNLQTAVSSYYEQFFTAEERRATGLKQVSDALEEVGLSLPESREGFRDLVSGIDRSTEAGREQFSVALLLADAFAQLTPELEATAEAARDAIRSFKEERSQLEIELARAQGFEGKARFMERREAIDGLAGSPAEIQAAAAVYDYNVSLRDQITALKDAKDAAKEAADERANLEAALLTARGDTVGLLALERAGLDASNRARFDEVKAAERATAIAKERQGLELQVLTLLDDKAAIRALEIAELDSTNAAIYNTVKALEDKRDAEDDEAKAAEKAAQALEKVRSQLEQTLNAIESGVESAFRGVESAVNDRRREIEKAAEDQVRDLDKRADTARSAFEKIENALSGLVDRLRQTAQDVLGVIDPKATRAAALATLTTSVASIRAGGKVDVDRISDAAALAAPKEENFGSALDFQRESVRTANLLTAVADATAASLANSKTDTDRLLEQLAAQTTSAEGSRDAQIAALDRQFDAVTAQYEALLNINVSVKTVEGAIAVLTSAMDAYAIATGEIAKRPTNVILRSGDAEAYLSSLGATITRPVGGLGDDTIITGRSGDQFTASAAKAFIDELVAAGDIRRIYERALAEGIDAATLDLLGNFSPGTAAREIAARGWAPLGGMQGAPSGAAQAAAAIAAGPAQQQAAAQTQATIRGLSGTTFTIEEVRAFIEQKLRENDGRAVYDAALREGLDANLIDRIAGFAAGTAAQAIMAAGWAPLPTISTIGITAASAAPAIVPAPTAATIPIATTAPIVAQAPREQQALIERGNAELVSQIQFLREELRAQALATLAYQGQVARRLDRWNVDGLPEVRDISLSGGAGG